ncbi:MAG: hypothetical protein JWM78_2555 [Verrucomicrobiaceae bacterium]|nr:hypothetical protein [Verrucomicrobiaceae bacterium]
MRSVFGKYAANCVAFLLTATIDIVHADSGGRLLATGAATQIEGSAGGGIVPMAVLSGYDTRDEAGGTAFVSRVDTKDYRLDSIGAAWSWRNRVELSAARQELRLDTLAGALGVPDNTIRQNVFGAKVRLYGDVVYTATPQISAGAQYKKNLDFFIPSAAGAKDDSGVDMYLAATKLFLAGFADRNVLLNGVVRWTKSNQESLVGFGGDKRNSREAVFEGSAGLFINRHWLIGTEYRQMPDNLSFARAQDWKDVFVAWFPDKQWSVVAAWVDLGDIATLRNQQGWYVSIQGSF